MKKFLLLTCSLALSVSCDLQSSFKMVTSGSSGVTGSGVVVEETRDVASFDSIKVEGSLSVHLSLGQPGPLRIKAEDNLIPLVIATVKGSELTLRTEGSYNTEVGIEVYATIADIHSIKTSGSTDVSCQGELKADEVNLEASGSSEIQCALKAGSLTVVASGASDLRLSGEVDLLNVQADGASTVAAFELFAAEAEINTSGASNVAVNANVLQTHASGASNIRYRGLPEKLTSKDRGTGSIGPEGT
jgi:hypothetical protein